MVSISTTFQPKAGLIVNKVTHKIISVLSLALVICMRIKLVVIYKASPMTPGSDNYGPVLVLIIPAPSPSPTRSRFPISKRRKSTRHSIVSIKHGVYCPINVAAHQGLPVV